jgi:hypothetical protein
MGRRRGSHRDMIEGSIADKRVKQRSTQSAVRIMAVLVADNQKLVLAFGEHKLLALDTDEGFEGRAGRPPAIRAVAVGRVKEFVRRGVSHRAAQALSGKLASHDIVPGLQLEYETALRA